MTNIRSQAISLQNYVEQPGSNKEMIRARLKVLEMQNTSPDVEKIIWQIKNQLQRDAS
jgi:hypothetical protein